MLSIPFPIPQNLTAKELGASTLLDYTERVRSIIDDINSNPPTMDEQCCNYEHQILDQHCASRPFVSQPLLCATGIFSDCLLAPSLSTDFDHVYM